MAWFSSNNLINECGLSCIENYAILILSQHVKNWESVFYKSIMCFHEILQCMEKGYSQFDGVQRIHKLASDMKLLNTNWYNFDNNKVENLDIPFFALQVKKEFIFEKYKKEMWRDDHYILVREKNNGRYDFINDNPVDQGIMEKQSLMKNAGNKLLQMEIICNNICKDKYYPLTLAHIKDIMNKIEIKYTQEITDPLIIRDAIGVQKVLVKRMAIYLRQFVHVDFAEEYYEKLQLYYVKIEYMRLKKKVGQLRLEELFKKIEYMDMQYHNNLYTVLRDKLVEIS